MSDALSLFSYVCLQISLNFAANKFNKTQEVFRKTLRTICLAQLENNTLRPVFEDFSAMKLYTAKSSLDTYSIFSKMEMYYRNCRVDCICAIDHDA